MGSMAGDIQIKICGLSEPNHVRTAVDAGARYLGFNFFQKSPRYVSLARARDLAALVPAGVAKVALTVNATDSELDELVSSMGWDMLQLHGSESPDRVNDIKARFGLPVMKALGVATEADLPPLAEYGRVADQILVDAKPAKDATLPGGNGLTFDWRLIAGRRWAVPWMLAGGLNAHNVAQAARLTGAQQVDVSSGVENAPGQKDVAKIRAFIQAAQSD